MEESQSGAPRSFDFSFPPHRRAPLRSETYLTLVRIISGCHDQSPRILTQDLKSDNGGNQLAQSCEDREPVELGSDTVEHENMLAQKDRARDKQLESSGSQDKAVSDTQLKIDEIEGIMRVEEVGDKIINESSEESGREQMILHELRHLLEGEDELARENDANVLPLPVKENNSFDDIFALTNDEKNHIDLPQIVMEEPGDACKLQVDKECNNQKVFGSIDSSSDKNVYREIPKINDNSVEKNSSLKISVLEVEHEIQLQGESELVKPAATSGIMSSMVPMIEDVEEGELSGDFSLDDMSLDLFCEDTVITGDKSKSEMQVSDGLVDKPDFHRNEKSDSKEKYSDSNSSVIGMVDSDGKVETDGSYNNKIMSKPELFVHRLPVEVKKAHGHDYMPETERNKKEGSGVKESFCSPESGTKTLVYYGDILEQNSCTQIKISEENTTKSKACLSAEQKNDDNLKKKTQGSRSGGSKKRKTERKRLKRAEMNRQQGVKRLKLLPEVKKPVSYCRHYLKGRCQEGEKCKFSHDVIPLTKSKPCCHFARNSCMKGDDCPFDHELSKYPCNNYTSTGSCFRGDDCMFSHQIPLKEDSPADVNASKLELKPALMPGDSSSKKQRSASGSAYQIQNANALTHSVGINSHTKSEKNLAETTLKSPGLAPKGISFISCGKPSMVESSKPKQVRPYPNIDNGVKVQIEQRASSPTVEILNETPKRNSPPVAPKGINFLSFGKPSGSMTGIVASNRDRIGKSPLLDNQIISKPASSLPGDDNSVAVGKQKAENALCPVQNETLKKIQPVEALFGTQTLSGKSFVKSDSQVMLPSRWGNASDGSSQEKQNLSNVPQNSSSAQWKMPALFTSGESSSGTSRNTPNSAQKALWSTLAFAAKYESGMKSNRATSALAPNAEPNKETGKASEILKFLSGIGSKTK